jgi:hypothetical protein
VQVVKETGFWALWTTKQFFPMLIFETPPHFINFKKGKNFKEIFVSPFS